MRTLAALALLLALCLASSLAAQTQPDPFHLIPASDGAGVPGEGTVTSVGLAAPADLFSVSGSPVTDAGTLTLTKAAASANTCYAGPVSGGAAAPTFRLLVAADIPSPLTSDTSGNAGTASAAASNPGNCSAGNLPRGVSATWTAEGCAPVNLATESTGAAPTATALAVDPANCGAGLLPRGVDAGGVAQGCAAVDLATESTGAAPTATALAANGTNCSATQAAIGVDASGNAEGCFTPSGGGTPGGSDTQVQYNDGGAFGGEAGLTYNETTDSLTVGALRLGNQGLVSLTSYLLLGTPTAEPLYFEIGGAGTGADWTMGTTGVFAVTSGGARIALNAGTTATTAIGPNGDDNTGINFSAADRVELVAGGVERLKVSASPVVEMNDALRLAPRASPPVTCGDAGTEGVIYDDSSVALCWCDGTAWQKLSGGGTCA